VAAPTADRTVALVDWSQLVEDFLDNIGVSLESFRDEMTGGWMFGYVAALASAGCRTVLCCVSARTGRTLRLRHRPTGATIYLLPAPAPYRAVRRRVPNPYAPTVEQAAGNVRGVGRAAASALKELAPLLCTPAVELGRVLHRERADAILCQEYEHPRFDVCVALGRLLGIPVFASFQGGDAPMTRLERPVRRLTLAASAGLVIASSGERERVRARYAVPARKLAAIFNPIDLADWFPEDRARAREALGIPAAARVAVWHGRVLMRRKGLDILLDAWERVRAERPGGDARLLLVGDGSDAAELRARLDGRPLGVTHVCEYVRDRALLRRYLSAADVAVLPSRHEGFPVAPIEAMACGIPVVAAAASGVEEILAGGEASGGVVVPREDPAALAAQLGRLLDDPARSSQLGRRARARAEEAFSLAAVGRQLREFLFPAAPGGEAKGEPVRDTAGWRPSESHPPQDREACAYPGGES
jgi:glycosyltransferase involved in cell wall biosynthesis